MRERWSKNDVEAAVPITAHVVCPALSGLLDRQEPENASISIR